ncbi:TPA: hypothetical protein ACF33E_004074 [Escherichia coli]
MSYGWLFESPDDDISGDNHINLEHLPALLQIVGGDKLIIPFC